MKVSSGPMCKIKEYFYFYYVLWWWWWWWWLTSLCCLAGLCWVEHPLASASRGLAFQGQATTATKEILFFLEMTSRQITLGHTLNPSLGKAETGKFL